MAQFETCLADYSRVVPELARLIRADYEIGTYEKAEEEFYESGEDAREWHLVGKLGKLRVLLEKHEGYLFSWFEAEEPQFKTGKELLWRNYLSQGGAGWLQEDPEGF